MIKIYRYELRRLVVSKVFLGLLVIGGVFGWQVLSRETIMGIAYTAPFSAWSYGAFMATILPMLLVALLFFVTHLFSNREARVRVLARATPMDQARHDAVKCAAIVTAFALLLVVVIGVSFVFYASVFEYWRFGTLLVPIAMTVVPTMLFVMGIGVVVGQRSSVWLSLLMLAVLVIGRVRLPLSLDLLGGTFFRETPLTLPAGSAGEPVFQVPTAVLFSRLGFAVVGLLLVGYGLRRWENRTRVG